MSEVPLHASTGVACVARANTGVCGEGEGERKGEMWSSGAEQWLQRHSEAGSVWPRWPQAS